MKFTKKKRIALELLGPPFIGAAPFLVWDIFTNSRGWKFSPEALLGVGLVLYVAYLCVGIQSILFTVVMEWRFARGLDPRSWQSVSLSTLLGFGSGAVVALAYGSTGNDHFGPWLFWAGLGLAVGLTMGLLIKALSKEKKSTGTD